MTHQKKQIRISEIIIPKYLRIFNDRKYRHIILTSGRAGTKSSFAAIRADYQLVSDPHGSVVVLRKHHNKLRKTVYKEMLRGINRLGISKKKFHIGKSPMEIRYKKYGTTMYFAGSDGIDDTKGIIDEDKPIKLVVLDELTEFFDDGEGEDEIQNIEATFIRGNNSGFQMIYLYNPPKNPNALINKWCRKMEQREDCIHIHTDYRDVPEDWLGPDLIESAETLKRADERQYRWVWLGQSIGVDEVIYYMFSERHKEKSQKASYRIIGIGVDYGQQNATTYQAFGFDEYGHKLDGLDEYYHSGRETGKQKSPSDYAKDFIELTDKLHEKYSCSYFYVFIDPSAKGLQEEIKRASKDCNYTVLIRDADNDVALGISRVQKLLIFDMLSASPRQQNAIDEFGTYEYDKKSIENGKEVPVKLDDHCMDAIRYLVMGFWNKLKPYLPAKEYEEPYKNPLDEDDDDEHI
jgi:PBSX family phage terminase large subunit